MNIGFLCLGGNLGNVQNTFTKVKQAVELNIGVITIESSIYQTEAWGDSSQSNYLNQVIKIDTLLSPHNLIKHCLSIEHQLGRDRNENNQYDSRTIDIDILLYNNEQIEEKNLSIPHPRMLERNFVMIPLNEIASEYIHPLEKEKISNLINKTNDKLKVEIVNAT